MAAWAVRNELERKRRWLASYMRRQPEHLKLSIRESGKIGVKKKSASVEGLSYKLLRIEAKHERAWEGLRLGGDRHMKGTRAFLLSDNQAFRRHFRNVGDDNIRTHLTGVRGLLPFS